MGVMESLKAFWSGKVPPTDKGVEFRPERDQSTEQRELVTMLMDEFQAAQTGNNQANERYDENLERWRRRNKIANIAEWRANIQTGQEFANIETQNNLIMSTVPVPEIRPLDNPQLEVVGIALESITKHWSKVARIRQSLLRSLRIMQLNGFVDSKLVWNPFLLGGTGDMELRVLDPRNVYVDSEASAWSDRQKLFEVEWMTPEECLEIFGDRARGLQSRYYEQGGLGTPSEAVNGIPGQKIRIIRCFWACLEREDVPVMGADDVAVPQTEAEDADDADTDVDLRVEPKALSRRMTESRLKYPSGRVSTFTDDGRLLDDRANPYPYWPHMRMHNYEDPHMAVGLSEMDLTREIQDTINRAQSNISDYLDMMGFPTMLWPSNAGSDPRQVTGIPGSMLVVPPAVIDKIRWQEVPPVQGWIGNYATQLGQSMDRITGIQEVMQGMRPRGLETFATLRALQESGMGRITPKATAFDEYFCEMIERAIYLVQTRYMTSRKMALSGEAAERLKAIAEDPQQMGIMKGNSGFGQQYSGADPVASMASVYQPDQVLKFLGSANKRFYFDYIGIGLQGAMSVEVSRGNLIAMSKSEIAAQAMQLAAVQVVGPDGQPTMAIDQIALLEALDWPGRQSMLERMKVAREQAMAAQQQAQAGAVVSQGFRGAPGPGQPTTASPTGQPEDFGPMDPDAENVLLAEGHILVVHPEDTPDHMQVHAAAMQQSPGESRPAFEAHLMMHQQGGEQNGQGT